MRRVLSSRAAVLTVLIGATVACGQSSGEYFGTLDRHGRDVTTYAANNSSEPESIDPGKASETAGSTLATQMFEGLTVYHPVDMHPVQGAAIAWDQSKDNRLYRFHMRPGAKWSDGTPVTAHDFEYSWKRVLRPATAAFQAANLYPVMNGQLFNTSKLKVMKSAAALAGSPDAGAAKVGDLDKGTPVEVLAYSPETVKTAVAPLPEVRKGAANVSFTKATGGAPEELSFDDGGAAVKASGDGWKGKVVTLLAVGPKILCNEEADRWFQVRSEAGQGWLPGCALGAAKSDEKLALVRRHERLPTFAVRASIPPPESEGAQLGFVPAKLLVEDDSVLGIRATDDLTFEVELGEPAPYFTDLTSTPTLAPVPRHVVDRFEAEGRPDMWTRPESIVTNGPYTLDEWKFRYEITLKRNPFYYDHDKLKIHRVVFVEVEEVHANMNLYKAGELDFMGDNGSPPPEYTSVISKAKDYHRYNFLSTYWLQLNVKSPPLDDVRVRRALNLAIDKKAIVERVTRAGQTPATHFVPDFTGLGYSDQVKADQAAGTDPFSAPEVSYNPELARKVLAEAGYPVVKDGDNWKAQKFPAIELLYNTNEAHRQIMIAIQDMWRRNLGVSANLRNEDWAVLRKNVRDGRYQIARDGWTADYNHPNTWLETFMSTSPQNQSRWKSEELDAALAKAAEEPDPKESIRLYRAAEKIAVDGMARIPIYFYTRSTLAKPYLKGFHGLSHGSHLVQFLWIDEGDWEKSPNVPAYEPAEFPVHAPYSKEP